MVARKLLLLLLFALQTWTPVEAINCESTVSGSCYSDKFCYYKEDGQHPHGRITTLCKPDKSYSGTSGDNDMNEICEEAERIQLNTPGYRQIIQDTKNWCFSPIYQEGYRGDILFCCTRSEKMNQEFSARNAVLRYEKITTTVPSLSFDQWQTTTTTTRRTTTTTTPRTTRTRRTTTTTRPTTTRTRRTRTTTTPTTTPTTTSPPTTTTSPPTTTTSPPTTTTSPTPKPKPTTTLIKTTTTPIQPSPSTSKRATNVEKSTRTAVNPTMTPGSALSVGNPEDVVQCHVKENMDGSADGGKLCEGRFCLIAIGSNDSYASGCADSTGMTKINEMLDSPLHYSTFCQGLSSDSEEACARCADRKTKTDSNIKICCTNKAQSNTLETVEKNVTCKQASSKDDNSTLVIIIVVILLVVLLLVIFVIVIVIVVRRKNESQKNKDKKKGKKGGKRSKKSDQTASTNDSRSTIGASPTMGGGSAIGGSPTSTRTGGDQSENTTRTNPNGTLSTTPTGGAKIAKSSTSNKNISKSSTPNKKNAKSSTKSKKSAARKPSAATTKTQRGNGKQSSDASYFGV